jgi:hypothetical protein
LHRFFQSSKFGAVYQSHIVLLSQRPRCGREDRRCARDQNLHNPFQRHPEVPTFHVLDLIEFAGEKIAQPMYSGDFHAHYGITT